MTTSLTGQTTSLVTHVLRLLPGDDLRGAIEAFAEANSIHAGFIMAAVGSLSIACLRPAGKSETRIVERDLEIVALSGTVAEGPAVHLHLAVADADGHVLGGHLQRGSIVRTTAELVLGALPHLAFQRAPDVRTGYGELTVSARDE